MLILNDREAEALKAHLQRITLESSKPVQKQHRIFNITQKAFLIIKKAERRQRNTINF